MVARERSRGEEEEGVATESSGRHTEVESRDSEGHFIVSLIVSRETFFEVKWGEVVVSGRITEHRDRPMPAEVK